MENEGNSMMTKTNCFGRAGRKIIENKVVDKQAELREIKYRHKINIWIYIAKNYQEINQLENVMSK